MMKHEYLPELTCCDLCKSPVRYIEFQKKLDYKKTPQLIGVWKCRWRGCLARISCHPGTRNPVGHMALSNLRRLRTECHKTFDLLWNNELSPFTRQTAYYWLSQVLKIPKDISNISKLTEEQIETVIRESKILYSNHIKEHETLRKGARKSLHDKHVKQMKSEQRRQKVKITANNYEKYI